MPADFLLYGSYGYTGDLIARLAVRRGMQPLLAGRDAGKLARQGSELGLQYRAFSLDEPMAIIQALEEVPVVLHTAGPYTYTARQMVDACLRSKTHYLDLTGEIPVFAAIQERDGEAREAKVMLLPGAGFDVAATDCLALHLKERLPEATNLTLAFYNRGPARPSQGTMKSVVEEIGNGLRVRLNGKVMRAPNPGKTRVVDFGYGPVTVRLFTWGDVFTAYYSTGIPSIENYIRLPGSLSGGLTIGHHLSPLLRQRWLKDLLRRSIESMPPGQTADQRTRTRTYIWGEVGDAQGRTVSARLQGPEAGYEWTPLIAVEVVRKVLSGSAPPGYQTPASAFGADFILECGGERQDDNSLA